MAEKLKPYCTVIEEEIIVVVFGDELIDPSGYEIEGYPFWYMLGTDAWFEKQTTDREDFLVARTHSKEFFRIFIDNNISKLLNKTRGVLVFHPNFELKAEEIKQTTNLEELRKWIDNEVGNGNIEGVIYCFYTEEDKKKYHKE